MGFNFDGHKRCWQLTRLDALCGSMWFLGSWNSFTTICSKRRTQVGSTRAGFGAINSKCRNLRSLPSELPSRQPNRNVERKWALQGQVSMQSIRNVEHPQQRGVFSVSFTKFLHRILFQKKFSHRYPKTSNYFLKAGFFSFTTSIKRLDFLSLTAIFCVHRNVVHPPLQYILNIFLIQFFGFFPHNTVYSW